MAYVDGGTANTVGTAEGAGAIFNAIKTALLAAGWELMASSNGTTYNSGSSPDNVPNLTEWSKVGAWCRLREPGGPGGREYVFMRATASTGIIKYSRSTGFVGGSPGLTTLPTTGNNGDGVVWVGTQIGYSPTGGAGAVPFANSYDLATTGTGQAASFGGSGFVGFRHGCIASNTPLNGVYGWWWSSWAVGTGLSSAVVYTEAVQAGTYPVEDTDPSYRQFSGVATFWAGSGPVAANLHHYWQAYGLTGYRYVVDGCMGLPTQVVAAGTTYSRGVPSTSIGFGTYYGTTVQTYPVLIGSPTAWPKGYSTGIGCINVNLNNCDTLNLTGAEPRIAMGMTNTVAGWVMPWVPNIVPLY
jgi:hypothetical protein